MLRRRLLVTAIAALPLRASTGYAQVTLTGTGSTFAYAHYYSSWAREYHAPLPFTSFGSQFWSNGWLQPTAFLAVVIFTYAIAPYEDWHRQAWAAGFVLLSGVLLVNIFALFILSRRDLVARR